MKSNKMIRLACIGIGFLFAVAAFLMFLAPFVSWNTVLSSEATHYTGYDLAFDKAYQGITTNWVLSLVLAVLALLICGLEAMAYFGKADLKFLNNKIVRLGLAGILAALGIAVGILAFCSRSMMPEDIAYAGYNLATATLGIGAILCGVFAILGGCATGLGVAIAPKNKKRK